MSDSWSDTNPHVIPAGCSTGLIPRDYSTHPVGCYAWASPFPDSELIPESDWQRLFDEANQERSSLLHMREDNYDLLKSLDQDGLGLCWAFSSTKASMYVRAIMNEPGLRFSGWYTAGIVKGWRDQGGWGASSLEQCVKNGLCTLDECPSYSSKYATSENAQKAAQRKIVEWWDGSDDPSTAQKQLVSTLLRRLPCVVDLNVMGHSMCAIWMRSVNPVEIIYDNSWGEQGDKGLYYGKGAYARPDGLVIPRVIHPSIA